MSLRTCHLVIAALGIACWPAEIHAQESERPSVDLRVTATRLSLEEFEELVPALKQFNLPRSLKIDELAVEGPRNDLKVKLAIGSASGGINGTLAVKTDAPRTRIQGTLRLDGAEVARVFEQPSLPSEFTGNVTFDITSTASRGGNRLAGTYRLDSRRIVAAGFAAENVRASGRINGDRIDVDATGAAYGARVTAKGNVQLPARGRLVAYEFAGNAGGLDLRRLPPRLSVPEINSRLDLMYVVSGRGTTVEGKLNFDPSTLLGAKVADGTKARFSWNGRVLEYEASGSIAGLDLARLGREASLAVLQEPRFAGQVTGEFSVVGRGSELSKLTLDLSDAKIFSGSLSGFRADLTWGEATLGYSLDGSFRELSLEQLADRPDPSGAITGRLSVKGEVPRTGRELRWREGSIAGEARLDRSVVEGLTIETLVAAGRVADGVMTLDRIEATGDARLKADGRVVFDAPGESKFTYHIEAPELAALRRRWPQSPEGGIVVDGTLTGPSSAPHFVGTMSGSSFRVGTFSALTVKSTYDATIPGFEVANLRVEAQTSATIVNIGRVSMPTADGKWSYGPDGLVFEATASDRGKTIEIAGGLRFGEGQQEFHLRRLALSANKRTWALAPSTEAVIRISDGQLEVVNPFSLIGSDQTVEVSGRLGESVRDSVLLRFENVDLAFLGSLADRRDLGGRLNAMLDLSGPLDAPRIQGNFEVLGGAVRQYRYESLSGTMKWEEGGIRLDARVNQDAATSITVTGFVPVGGAGGENGTARELDLIVRSDTISLSAIQGVTSYLTNVTGTAKVDVRVTGALGNPIVVGDVQITGGAFDVPVLGTRYTGLDTTIRFEPKQILLTDFILRDTDDRTIHVTGSLPALGLRDGAAAIDVLVNEATILDGDLGHLELVGVMRITADPQWLVTGSLEVVDGELRVDRWLQRRPRPAAAKIDGLLAISSAPDDAPGLLADLPIAMDLQLNTEGLLLRGRNLRRDSPLSLGLGDVNLTTDGSLHITKGAGEGLQILGDLQMVRGTYSFQGREFEIDRGGVVRFTGGAELNPIIDITGRREITGVQTQVTVNGTLREPRLMLRSQPPLEEPEILSLIVFNEPVNTLGSGEQFSLAQRGAALAGGALTSAFSETLADALDVDLFDFQVATSEVGVGGVLTIGERLGDRVFVKARQLFGPDSPTEVSIEYDISRHWRLQTSVVEDRSQSRTYRRPPEKGSVDLKFAIRY